MHGPRARDLAGRPRPRRCWRRSMEAWRSRRAALLAGGAGYVLAGGQRGRRGRRVARPLALAAGAVPRSAAADRARGGGVPGRLPAVPAAGNGRARAGRPGRLLPAVRARAVRDLDRAGRPPSHTRRWTRPQAARWPTRSRGCAGCWGRTWPGTPCCTRAPPGDETFHWHIELWPRLTVAASIELGAGIWVNVVDPAAAAGELVAAAARRRRRPASCHAGLGGAQLLVLAGGRDRGAQVQALVLGLLDQHHHLDRRMS